jgi:tetratricopeptide (TPR) repeat protein
MTASPNPSPKPSLPLLSTYARIHRPTPYSVTLATLMCLHASNSSSTSDENEHKLSPFTNNETILQKIDAFLQEVLLQTNAPFDPAVGIHPGPTVLKFLQQFYSSLHKQEQNDVDPDNASSAAVIVHRFHVWLMVATQTMDSFMDMVVATLQRSMVTTTTTSAETPSADRTIDKTSMMGVYIRSLLVGLDALSFEQMTHLWCCMKEEIHHQIQPSLYRDVDSPVFSDSSKVPQWTLTKEQLDSSLRDSIYASTLPPPSILSLASNDGASIPAAAHYRKYLDSLQSGDRVAAVHSLHSYMDASFAASSSTNASSSDVLQYASVLQAMLHDQFGEVHHMIDAVNEAICVTQQQPPMPSPTASASAVATPPTTTSSTAAALYAVAWLSLVQQQWPTSMSNDRLLYQPQNHKMTLLVELLQRCIQRGVLVLSPKQPTTTLVPSLMMGIHLLLASVTNSWIPYQNATTLADPMLSSSSRTAASTNSVMGSIGSATSTSNSVYDRPIHALHLGEQDTPLFHARPNLSMRQKLVASGIYNHYSEHSLSMCSLLETLQCTSRNAPVSDPSEILAAIRNLSIVGCTTGSTTIPYDRALAVSEMEGAKSPMYPVNGCVYGNALRTYVSLCDAYHISVIENKLCFLDVLLLVHEWAVHRHDMEHARPLLTIIEGLMHDSSIQKYYSQNMDAIMYQKVLLLSRQGQMDAAKRLLQKFISHFKAQERHRSTANALLNLASLHLEESSPQHALRPLLECLSISKQHKMDGTYTEGLAVLAQIHLYFRQYSRTSLILQMILPSLHRCSPIKVQAEAYLTLAKCRMYQANDCPGSKAQRRHFNLLQASIQELQRSRQLFERCHECKRLQEIYYLLAHVYQLLSCHSTKVNSTPKKTCHPKAVDYVQLRDAAAATFLQYNTLLSSCAEHRVTDTRPTTAQFMSAFATKDGILNLANRVSPIA